MPDESNDLDYCPVCRRSEGGRHYHCMKCKAVVSDYCYHRCEPKSEQKIISKETRLLCALCKKLEKKYCIDISNDIEGGLISRELEVWWKKYKKNRRCRL